ncbi:hypothetical protein NEOLEDRAFT_1172060 [Neolentinus lepideus HHB14362 ss-1]|uniref:Uncharacterized protein n=1 Tax=Neolentinus lepideus HHB14362 ss-1 TaxID=1314782 RepID=A0A165PMU3_9AGAM|nr:hypothetical protein NEOLEDRAFT_1172060 [Neolentinus lepideus HHB14362 ss-1]
MVFNTPASKASRNRTNTWPLFSFQSSYNELVAASPLVSSPLPSLHFDDTTVRPITMPKTRLACEEHVEYQSSTETPPRPPCTAPSTPELPLEPATPNPELANEWREHVAPEVLNALYEVQARFKDKMIRLSAINASNATIESLPKVASLEIVTDYVELAGHMEKGLTFQHASMDSDPFIFDRYLDPSEVG